MLLENRIENIHICEFESYDFPVHLHRNTELIICTGGTLQVCCNNRTKILKKGDIMIAFPYDIHSYTRTDSGSGIMLVFNSEVSKILSGKFSVASCGNFASDEGLIDILHNLCTEFEADTSFLTMYGYLHIIIASVMKQLDSRETHQEDKLFIEALKFVTTNYTDALTLRTVADELGVSQQHLSRLFSEKVDGGFCTYLHILRISYAKELLCTRKESICEILTECGFTNQRTFNRVFKELVGMTPGEFRTKYRIEDINE